MTAKPVRVQLERRGGRFGKRLAAALAGNWLELPEHLSPHDLNVIAHLVNGYDVAQTHLGRDVGEVVSATRPEDDRGEPAPP